MGENDGLALFERSRSDEATRNRVAESLRSPNATDELATVELTEVRGATRSSHHTRRHRPYVAVVNPSHSAAASRGRLAVVRNRNNGRVLSTVAFVVSDPQQAPGTVALD